MWLRMRAFTLKATDKKTGQSTGLFFSKSIQNDTITAWFGALCFFLSTIEYMIPKPLPFLRLGLANIPILLAIDILPLPAYSVLVLLKILGQGLIGGTLFSYIFLFSAAGSVLVPQPLIANTVIISVAKTMNFLRNFFVILSHPHIFCI